MIDLDKEKLKLRDRLIIKHNLPKVIEQDKIDGEILRFDKNEYDTMFVVMTTNGITWFHISSWDDSIDDDTNLNCPSEYFTAIEILFPDHVVNIEWDDEAEKLWNQWRAEQNEQDVKNEEAVERIEFERLKAKFGDGK